MNTSSSSRRRRHEVSVSSVSRHVSPYPQGLSFWEVNLNLCVVRTFFRSVWLVDEKSASNLVNSHRPVFVLFLRTNYQTLIDCHLAILFSTNNQFEFSIGFDFVSCPYLIWGLDLWKTPNLMSLFNLKPSFQCPVFV